MKSLIEVNGSPAYLPPDIAQSWCDVAAEVFHSSGLFAMLVAPDKPADLRAEIEVLDRSSGSFILGCLSGFTALIIPCKGTSDFTWKTTFKDGTGAVRGIVEKREKLTTWYQLFLVFALLSESPDTTFDNMLHDLNRATLLEAFQSGYLKP